MSRLYGAGAFCYEKHGLGSVCIGVLQSCSVTTGQSNCGSGLMSESSKEFPLQLFISEKQGVDPLNGGLQAEGVGRNSCGLL